MHGAALAAAALLVAPAAIAQTCPGLSGGVRVESERYVLAYRTQPDTVPVGRHFTMELVVCARDGSAAVEGLRIDAHMPEHRHGMNYKVVVRPGDAAGRYLAEGFLFHMRGRWEIVFEVRGQGRTDRVTRSVAVD